MNKIKTLFNVHVSTIVQVRTLCGLRMKITGNTVARNMLTWTLDIPHN